MATSAFSSFVTGVKKAVFLTGVPYEKLVEIEWFEAPTGPKRWHSEEHGKIVVKISEEECTKIGELGEEEAAIYVFRITGLPAWACFEAAKLIDGEDNSDMVITLEGPDFSISSFPV